MAQSAQAIYWSAVIADFRRSGLTHVEFCRRRQISVHAFRHWLYHRLPGLQSTSSASGPTPAAAGPTPSSTPPFLPVHIRPEPIPDAVVPRGTRSAPPLELVLADDRRLLIPPGFDPDSLHQVLDVLEGRP
jgi:hypothetical protein